MNSEGHFHPYAGIPTVFELIATQTVTEALNLTRQDPIQARTLDLAMHGPRREYNFSSVRNLTTEDALKMETDTEETILDRLQRAEESLLRQHVEDTKEAIAASTAARNQALRQKHAIMDKKNRASPREGNNTSSFKRARGVPQPPTNTRETAPQNINSGSRMFLAGEIATRVSELTRSDSLILTTNTTPPIDTLSSDAVLSNFRSPKTVDSEPENYSSDSFSRALQSTEARESDSSVNILPQRITNEFKGQLTSSSPSVTTNRKTENGLNVINSYEERSPTGNTGPDVSHFTSGNSTSNKSLGQVSDTFHNDLVKLTKTEFEELRRIILPPSTIEMTVGNEPLTEFKEDSTYSAHEATSCTVALATLSANGSNYHNGGKKDRILGDGLDPWEAFDRLQTVLLAYSNKCYILPIRDCITSPASDQIAFAASILHFLLEVCSHPNIQVVCYHASAVYLPLLDLRRRLKEDSTQSGSPVVNFLRQNLQNVETFFPRTVDDIRLMAWLCRPEHAGLDLHSIQCLTEGEPSARSTEKIMRRKKLSQENISDVRDQLVKTLEIHRQLSGKLRENGLLFAHNEIERKIAFLCCEMHINGMMLDVKDLHRNTSEVRHDMTHLQERAYVLAGKTFNLQSADEIRRILFDELKLPSEGAAVTKGGKISTNEEHLRELAQLHELPQVIIQYRKKAKLIQTYVDGS